MALPAAVTLCLFAVVLGNDATRQTLYDGTESANTAPRIVVKSAQDLYKFVQDGENGNVIVGCFAVDEEGGVVGRNDTDSHYGVFRDSAVKNRDVPFGIIKDADFIKQIGIDQRRLPVLLALHFDEGADHIEFRKAQFFEDQTVYFSEDSSRVVSYLKHGPDGFTVKDMRPRGPNPNAPKQEPTV